MRNRVINITAARIRSAGGVIRERYCLITEGCDLISERRGAISNEVAQIRSLGEAIRKRYCLISERYGLISERCGAISNKVARIRSLGEAIREHCRMIRALGDVISETRRQIKCERSPVRMPQHPLPMETCAGRRDGWPLFSTRQSAGTPRRRG